MAELVPISLSKGSGRGRYDMEASARLINCYMETSPEGGKNQFALYAVNGWETFATLTGASGGIRGLLSLDEELIAVAGRQLYSVASDGSDVLIGGIPSDGLVTMARNRRQTPQCVIVCDGRWYIYEDGLLSEGDETYLPSPIYVVAKDGYFIFLDTDGTITVSGIDDVTIDGLDFANAQSSPDGGVALATRGTDVVVFGSNSTEFWLNTGNADFPFERQVYRNFGCFAAGSVSEITALIGGTMVDSVVWAATDEKGAYTGLYLMNGYEAQKISTYEIDRAIESEPRPSDIRAFAWSENGHVFYTIKGSSYSWTYDTVEGQWHERRTHRKSYWAVSDHETFGGNPLFGDDATGTIYRSDRSMYDADGETIEMEVQLPLLHMFPYEFVLNRVRVDAVTGVGLNSTDDHLADPQIMLDISRNGGRDFGAVIPRPLGRDAQTNQRLEWRGLGRIAGQGAVLRLRISAGVRRAVLGAAIDHDRLAA